MNTAENIKIYRPSPGFSLRGPDRTRALMHDA
jgi:hypothetical protein